MTLFAIKIRDCNCYFTSVIFIVFIDCKIVYSIVVIITEIFREIVKIGLFEFSIVCQIYDTRQFLMYLKLYVNNFS